MAGDLLLPARELGRARPLAVRQLSAASPDVMATTTCVRIVGYYHNSLTEGPGRHSSMLFQSCPLRCKGCWTPQLHSLDGGSLASVDRQIDPTGEPARLRDRCKRRVWPSSKRSPRLAAVISSHYHGYVGAPVRAAIGEEIATIDTRAGDVHERQLTV